MRYILGTNGGQAATMISASEARRITDAANFEKSGAANSLNILIRKAADNGDTHIGLHMEERLADQAADFLTQHGFRVAVDKSASDGVKLVRAYW